MNIGKIRRLLRNAERMLGFVDRTSHGRRRHHYRRHHHYGHRSVKHQVGDAVLRRLLRRIR